MKKRVAILLSGQTRTSKLNPDYNSDDLIIDSIKMNLINPEFKERYDYDVFFSTDKINIDLAIEVFGVDRIKNINLIDSRNIHQIKSKLYLHETSLKIPDYSIFYEKYTSINFGNSAPYLEQLVTMYRHLDVCNLLLDYQLNTNTTYDYVYSNRPDVMLNRNMLSIFDMLENNTCDVFAEHAMFLCFKYEYIDILKIIYNYGNYTQSINTRPQIYKFLHTNFNNDSMFMYCSEKQIVDHIYNIMLSKNKDFNKYFVGIPYGNYTKIYRGNGKFAYS
jgi:hypothetical protein